MHVRKAQSATEYLMTYGWAILAIMIVGVLLYSYVFNERNCTYGANGFPPFASILPAANEYSVNADGSIDLLLASRLEKDANITELNGVAIGPHNITAGGQVAVHAGAGTMDAGTVGKCYGLALTITYKTGIISELKSTGILNGRYG
ncbi:MAG: hypothetical protein KAJ91_00190 [Candidatus Aenigmarchaeota archaeon]|nr:hypothetical protein [Candidatus Aenigmarchaeota archaeon]